MKKEELVARLVHASDEVLQAEPELTEIDAKFGDADHGLTMAKIAKAIRNGAISSHGNIKGMLDDVATGVMMLNGGSAVPLWNTWLDGLQDGAPDEDTVDANGLKAMFSTAYDALEDISGAKVGDKTMMDALIPATEAITKGTGDEAALLAKAAEAAEQGAEATKAFVSKYGRAKSYGEKTIGTPDAGAVSMARFFRGLAKK